MVKKWLQKHMGQYTATPIGQKMAKSKSTILGQLFSKKK
tara:strand:- start:99 stop:215 length:117 start_codon:yes stop_codon:yes gene_type:complete